MRLCTKNYTRILKENQIDNRNKKIEQSWNILLYYELRSSVNCFTSFRKCHAKNFQMAQFISMRNSNDKTNAIALHCIVSKRFASNGTFSLKYVEIIKLKKTFASVEMSLDRITI